MIAGERCGDPQVEGLGCTGGVRVSSNHGRAEVLPPFPVRLGKICLPVCDCSDHH